MEILLTDCTLSSLDAYEASPGLLYQLLREIEKLPVHAMELSPVVYEKLRPFRVLQEGRKKYILHKRQNKTACPGFDGYLMMDYKPREPGEATKYYCMDGHGNRIYQRLRGFDSYIGKEASARFQQMESVQKQQIEIAPVDTYHCATAVGMAWIMQGGSRIAGSLAGIDGGLCMEELLLAVHTKGLADFSGQLVALPRAKSLLEQITGKRISRKKPVLGQDIFAVEAGIHVDGLQKDSKLYEPYSPELVGLKRHIVIGKYSGRSAVMIKARELGIELLPDQVPEVLACLQEYCAVTRHGLSDDKFRQLIMAEQRLVI